MSAAQRGNLLQQLRRLIGGASGADLADGQLLDAFRLHHDEAAFAALVRRHGALVLGVCRRVLNDAHEAEDAFQAVFLVLARRADAIRRPEALPSWLHGVAFKVATRLRQRRGQQGVPIMPTDPPETNPLDPVAAAGHRELRGVLDEELNRLPERFRLPLVLCYLEGKSNEEAARQLGWTKGTVSGQLARARDLLRGRLARRGLALAAATIATAVADTAASAALPPALVDATARCAGAFVAHQAASTQAVLLAQETLHMMTVTKFAKATAAALLLVGFVASAGAVTYHFAAPAHATPLPEIKPAVDPKPAPMENAKAERAPVVLRVTLLKSGPTEKYGWDEVAILHVLKNTSGQTFGKTLSVAHINVKAGVPTGDSTIYLVPYNGDAPNNGLWKLLTGGGPDAVSHVKSPEKK